MYGDYVKVIGIKFDVLNGLRVVADYNEKTFKDAGFVADKENDGDTIFICVPCTYKCWVRFMVHIFC